MLAVTIAKLFVHPLILGVAFWAVFGWADPVTRDAILFACMPLFLSFVVFCGSHKVGDVGASAIVMSTLVGALTFTKSMFKGAVAATAMMAGTMASSETLTMSSWVPPTHFVHTDFLVPFTEKVA